MNLSPSCAVRQTVRIIRAALVFAGRAKFVAFDHFDKVHASPVDQRAGGRRPARRSASRRGRCRASIARLGVGSVGIYSLHAPLPYVGGRRALYEGLARVATLASALAWECVTLALPQLREAHRELKRLGVPLVSNQIRYSILNIERELDGTIETCLELGVTPIAHTAGGRPCNWELCTCARAAWWPARPHSRFHSNQLLPPTCFEAMSSVSEDAGRMPSGPRSETEVALNFARAKGCVPIPGVNTGAQAREVVAALDWDLDLAQVEALSEQAVLLHARRRELSWLKNV